MCTAKQPRNADLVDQQLCTCCRATASAIEHGEIDKHMARDIFSRQERVKALRAWNFIAEGSCISKLYIERPFTGVARTACEARQTCRAGSVNWAGAAAAGGM